MTTPGNTGDPVARRLIDLAMLEYQRTAARYELRFDPGYVCPVSGEPCWVAIGLGETSIAIRTAHGYENHHVPGQGQGETVRVPTAVNRIIKECERIADAIHLFDHDLSPRYLFGIGVLLGVLITRIGLVS